MRAEQEVIETSNPVHHRPILSSDKLGKNDVHMFDLATT